ncbi:MAG: hypothetical protein M1837_003852 [Sclerophora amabilis]|nr:MAG: hypothetical protein M1837_003852 [Sclerophora amabilis]
MSLEGNPRAGTESEPQTAGLSGPANFLNTTVDDVRQYLHFDDEEEEIIREWYNEDGLDSNDSDSNDMDDLPHPSSLVLSSSRSTTSNTDAMLIAYYESVICSSSTLLDDEANNPYRFVILPMALQSDALYQATLAISANTLRLKHPEYAVIALGHRQKALKGLIDIINRPDCGSRETDEMLGLVLMLCWFEICDGCRSTWVNHLKGFRSLMHRRQQCSNPPSIHSENLSRFFTRYFAYHFVMAKTAFRVEDMVHTPLPISPSPSTLSDTSSEAFYLPKASPSGRLGLPQSTNVQSMRDSNGSPDFGSSTDFLSLSMSIDSLDEIDPYKGFSNALLLLINDVADLAQQPLTSNPAGEEEAILLQARVDRLRTSLGSLKQFPPSQGGKGGKNGAAVQTTIPRHVLITTAEAYRLATLVFLHETCSPSSSSAIATDSHPLPSLDQGEKTACLKKILSLLDKDQEDMNRTATFPLWPLFIAGCCTKDEGDRNVVLRMFLEAESHKRFGNLSPARKVVEMVWRQLDLAQDDRFRDTSSNASRKPANSGDVKRTPRKRNERYEWERAMAMMGNWKISLT